MSREIELLTEIRNLLQVMAEPALAKRDAKARSVLRDVVGTSSKKSNAVLLMNGANSQADLVKATGIDAGNLSRLVKALAEAKLISGDQKRPSLNVTVPPTFFEKDADE